MLSQNNLSISGVLAKHYSPIIEPPAFLVLRHILNLESKDTIEIDSILEKLSRDYDSSIPLLPDDNQDSNLIKYSYGAEDGISSFHLNTDDDLSEDLANRVYKIILEMSFVFSESPSDFIDNYKHLKNIVASEIEIDGKITLYENSVTSFAFPLLRIFARNFRDVTDAERLQKFYELGKFLAFDSSDRFFVKIGLLLMASVPKAKTSDEDFDNVLTIGRHEEFTWYAARFFYLKLSNPLTQIWELAIAAKEWGRIFAIYELKSLLEVLNIETPYSLQRWLLTEGYKNGVMPIYTALPIIEMANLKDKLNEVETDDKLLKGAETLLQSVVQGGPINFDFENSSDFQEMFKRYKFHVSKTPERREKFSDSFIS